MSTYIIIIFACLSIGFAGGMALMYYKRLLPTFKQNDELKKMIRKERHDYNLQTKRLGIAKDYINNKIKKGELDAQATFDAIKKVKLD